MEYADFMACSRKNSQGRLRVTSNQDDDLKENGVRQPTLRESNGLEKGPQVYLRYGVRFLGEVEKAWLAGVIDREGSIFLSKVSGPEHRRGFFYHPQIGVSNSNRSFVVRVQQVISEGTVHLAKRGMKGLKARWEYNATAGVLRAILRQILPYTIVKRKQTEKMIEYFNYIDENPIFGRTMVERSYYENLDSLYSIIKKLN